MAGSREGGGLRPCDGWLCWQRSKASVREGARVLAAFPAFLLLKEVQGFGFRV